jgi:4-hydroxyphenylacetate 3-monooxygenase
MVPSSVEDFADPELATLIGRTQYSPVTDSKGRVKLFKLAWDALGSEFGSRHTQYEMFYSGPKVVTTGMAYRTFDWDRATTLVDRCMEGYDLPASTGTSGPPRDRRGST